MVMVMVAAGTAGSGIREANDCEKRISWKIVYRGCLQQEMKLRLRLLGKERAWRLHERCLWACEARRQSESHPHQHSAWVGIERFRSFRGDPLTVGEEGEVVGEGGVLLQVVVEVVEAAAVVDGGAVGGSVFPLNTGECCYTAIWKNVNMNNKQGKNTITRENFGTAAEVG